MDENSAIIEQILREDEQEFPNQHNQSHHKQDASNGWQTVTYAKRNRRPSKPLPNGSAAAPLSNGADVFRPIELHSEDRRRRAQEAQLAMSAGDGDGSKRHSDDDEDGSDVEASGAAEKGTKEVKKVKPKKPKQPKVSVSDAAAKIDAGDLGAYLVDITDSYEAQQDIQLMRFADYFGRAFASVGVAQFPWVKIFKESPVAKLVDIPLCHIPKDVYTTSVDWLSQKNPEALSSFVIWSLDSICADLNSHQGVAKGSKKGLQQAPSKCQVAIFVALGMVLQQKPEVLVNLLPVMKDNPKYQGQDKLPVIVWIVSQASQGDLVVGLYMWVQILLPVLNSKSGNNPQARDLILQLLERIMSTPKAPSILLNGAVRKGERLVPPHAFEVLMRFTFPATSGRVKATDRFEAVYPTLKKIALAGTPASKGLKQAAHQIASFTIEAAGEDITGLSNEASEVFIWCLSQNSECYKLWDKLYMDNLDASAIILRKLSDQRKTISVTPTALESHREALKAFRHKNEQALESESDGERRALLKQADKYCKILLARAAKPNRCFKSLLVISFGLAVGAAAIMSQNAGLWDQEKLSEMLAKLPEMVKEFQLKV